MLGLALLATLPVVLGIAIAGLLGARLGAAAFWLTLLATFGLAVLVWGLQGTGKAPAMQRFGPAVAVYAPPFLLGASILTFMGLPDLGPGRIGLVAVVIGAANVFLGQFFFVLGCVANLWDCP